MAWINCLTKDVVVTFSYPLQHKHSARPSAVVMYLVFEGGLAWQFDRLPAIIRQKPADTIRQTLHTAYRTRRCGSDYSSYTLYFCRCSLAYLSINFGWHQMSCPSMKSVASPRS